MNSRVFKALIIAALLWLLGLWVFSLPYETVDYWMTKAIPWIMRMAGFMLCFSIASMIVYDKDLRS